MPSTQDPHPPARQRRRRRSLGILTVASTALAALGLVAGGSARADGTETLGAPSVEIAEGTGVATAGVGTTVQPASMTVDVPDDASVSQVLLYWEGIHHRQGTGDDTIVVDGVEVTGTLIGGPSRFTKRRSASAYRADITALDLVDPGESTFAVEGLDFLRQNGAGLVVVFDDGSTPSDIQVADGLDIAIANSPYASNETDPRRFDVAPSSVDRTAELSLQVGDVAPERPHQVVVTVDGQAPVVFTDLLRDADGDSWDAVTVPVALPAGSESLTVRIDSVDDATDALPASLIWVSAVLDVDETCLGRAAPANADGRAFGVRATLLGQDLGTYVSTDEQNPAQGLALDLAPLPVGNLLLQAASDADITADAASNQATAVLNDLDLSLPGFTVAADTIVARATSTAASSSAGSSRAGSVVQGLVVNGESLGDFSQPQTIVVNSGILGTGPELVVTVLGGTGGGAAAGVTQPDGGFYSSALTVEGLRIQVFPTPGAPLPSTDLVLAHAHSSASAAARENCPADAPVAGEAAVVALETLGDAIDSSFGHVVLPSTGGAVDADLASIPTLGSATGSSSTTGDPDVPAVHSTAAVENVDLLGRGRITATLIEASADSDAAGETGTVTIAGLVADGVDVCAALGLDPVCSPEPNTVVDLSPGLVLVLNEQVPSPTGGLTVNAVHLTVLDGLDPSLPTGLDVVIATASADATA